MKSNITEKQIRAKERVKELKDFYYHLTSYMLVNLFISVAKIIGNLNNGETLSEAFWDFGTFAIWVFWGIGLMFHALKVFSFNPIFGKDWEKRQIEKYMEQDRREADKYR